MSAQPRILRNVRVPMRDGINLATDIYLPPEEGSHPVVLVRTAYNRNVCYDPYFEQHGTVYVVQDCRGRYDSEGEHYPFVSEAEDGEDMLDWLRQQPWCNGRVGMFGDSYLGATQYAVAPSGNPLLTALNPRFMSGDCWKRAYYIDGVFSLALTWSWLCFECASRTSQAAVMPRYDVPALLWHLPILTMDEASGVAPVQVYRDYVSHNRYDELWRQLNIKEQMGEYRVPLLLTAGWYDNYAADACVTFNALLEKAPTDELRAGHRLLIGPWTHGINWVTTLGELDFGDAALAENTHTYRWLDTLLHGGKPADVLPAPVRIFVMGLNQWRDEYEWPLSRTQYANYYLHAGGALSPQAPQGNAAPDRYTYDPEHPAPTLGGNHSVGPYNPGLYEHAKPGPYDQRPNESRPDVLTFTSDPLPRDTEITGPIVLKLYAASSAPDTDFVAKLIDVYPDGRAMNLTEGVIRARFREDVWGEPKLMQPEDIYLFTIDLQVTSNVFKAGHRLRVDITSSNFPLWDRNLNTGNDPATDTEMAVAQQTIYHDAEHPSHIVLPVIS
ncbi:MAG: CocE/NonD family hydrolase [Armatimonadota bacterium]